MLGRALLVITWGILLLGRPSSASANQHSCLLLLRGYRIHSVHRELSPELQNLFSAEIEALREQGPHAASLLDFQTFHHHPQIAAYIESMLSELLMFTSPRSTIDMRTVNEIMTSQMLAIQLYHLAYFNTELYAVRAQAALSLLRVLRSRAKIQEALYRIPAARRPVPDVFETLGGEIFAGLNMAALARPELDLQSQFMAKLNILADFGLAVKQLKLLDPGERVLSESLANLTEDVHREMLPYLDLDEATWTRLGNPQLMGRFKDELREFESFFDRLQQRASDPLALQVYWRGYYRRYPKLARYRAGLLSHSISLQRVRAEFPEGGNKSALGIERAVADTHSNTDVENSGILAHLVNHGYLAAALRFVVRPEGAAPSLVAELVKPAHQSLETYSREMLLFFSENRGETVYGRPPEAVDMLYMLQFLLDRLPQKEYEVFLATLRAPLKLRATRHQAAPALVDALNGWYDAN